MEGLARHPRRNTDCASGRGSCSGGGRPGQPGDWPGSWLDDRNGLEAAGTLRARPPRRAFGDRNRGAAPKYTAETNKRILSVLDRPVPAGHRRWTGALIAADLGDVDVQYVWRFLRAQKIDLARASPGARATIRPSRPRRPRSSGSISIPRRRPGAGGGREAVDPGSGAGAGLPCQRRNNSRPAWRSKSRPWRGMGRHRKGPDRALSLSWLRVGIRFR